jgi:hypothetical protein
MDEPYSPQALEVLAKATMFAAEEIEGTRRQPQVATSRPTLNEHTGIVRLAREVL